jgi:integrase/recombinase XerC
MASHIASSSDKLGGVSGELRRMHPDFVVLAASWELALRADGYAERTVDSYHRALFTFAGWLHEQDPAIAPHTVSREHVRGWIVHLRQNGSNSTARSWFAGLRHFFRWMVAEQESDHDPTEGIRTPPPSQVLTPVLSADSIRALLATCSGRDFTSRRDAAIIFLFADGGLRLAELADLTMSAVDIRDRILYVEGKGSNRSGPRRRAVPVGIKAAQALDRYLRERRRHPYAELPQLWLGSRGRPTMSRDGVKAMLNRRGGRAGVQLHPHMFRHTWASAFRAAGGSEGDLMVLGGWRSRTMLDRYGATVAADRAREAYRRMSMGDRL